MLQHGINTYKDDTGSVAVQVAACGVPFFIGAAPVYAAKGFNAKPVLCNDFAEAKAAFGYSTEWRDERGAPKWSICQAMYAHFMLAGMSPAIFYNVFDPAVHKTEVPAADYPVDEHSVKLSTGVIKNDALTVKSGDMALIEGTDFEAFYTDIGLTIELLEDGAAYDAAVLTISYDSADPSKITAQDIEFAVETVEMCYSLIGIVPDLLVAPGWSSDPTVAAVMATKASSINGLFYAKAIVDIDTAKVTEYGDILNYKNNNGLTSEYMMVCWPMVRSGDYIFDLSVVAAGLMAKVDSGNGNCPYESPSNKSLSITGALVASGDEVTITIAQADIISVTDGVVTVLNNGGWTLWGNYLACFPKFSDVAKIFVCTNRVQDWICNTFVKTFWQYLDRPLTPALRDAIINSFNSWLNGLTAEGKLYGGEITYNGEFNPVSALMGGTIRLDTVAASPVPMQRVDMHATYSVDMLQSALS